MSDMSLQSNPTQPVREEAPAATYPPYTLFDSTAVTVAAFFGGPVAGSSVMALNYRRLGQKYAAYGAIALGIFATVVAVVIANFLPKGMHLVIGIGLVYGTREAARAIQGRAVKEHILKGGMLGSNWVGFGIGMAVLAVLSAAILGPILVSSLNEHKVVVGTSEVYYKGSATKEEAASLGNTLTTKGYFGDTANSTFLEKGKGGTIVSFVLREGAWDEQGVVQAFQEIGSQLAPSVGGFPIKVRLINQNRETKKEFTVGKLDLGSEDNIFYYGDASEADAKAFADALKADGYFGGKGSSVLLAKDGAGTVISFVVKDGFWDDPAHVSTFEKIVKKTAKSVGGLPVTMRLVNSSVEVKTEVVVQ